MGALGALHLLHDLVQQAVLGHGGAGGGRGGRAGRGGPQRRHAGACATHHGRGRAPAGGRGGTFPPQGLRGENSKGHALRVEEILAYKKANIKAF